MITLTIKPDHLRALLLFAARHDCRHYLNGIHAHSVEGDCFLRLEATDGHRAIICRTHISVAPGISRIIPTDVCVDALKHCRKRTEYVEVYLDDTQVTLAPVGSPARVGSTLIEGTYPDLARNVVSTTNGEAIGYNWRYLADCDEAARLLTGSPNAFAVIGFNGTTGAAIARLAPDAFAIVMPRAGVVEPHVWPPEWFRARRAPVAA